MKNAPRKRRRILAIAAFFILLLLGLSWWVQPRIQRLTLADGTEVQFLGMTEGTIHWNPSAPFLFRALYRIPGLSEVVFPMLPKSPRNLPSMAVTPKSGAVLWFYVDKEPIFGRVVFSCLSGNGAQMGAFGNVDFRSATNAAAVWLQAAEPESLTNIHSIEIYLREMPLSAAASGVFNPVSEMDIYPGIRVGEFKVPRE